jgi:hypothetical protein
MNSRVIKSCLGCNYYKNFKCLNTKYIIRHPKYPELVNYDDSYNIRSDFTKCGIDAKDYDDSIDKNTKFLHGCGAIAGIFLISLSECYLFVM